jgi:L-alanine-DL-glutamate epimerase-like enolase superfamily enzyme
MPVAVDSVEARAFTVPTDGPESDGTLEWDSTTLVLVRVEGGGKDGLGYTYGHSALAPFVREKLASTVRGSDAMAPPRVYEAMTRAVRNLGRPGALTMAISAVDTALWDLKAKLLGLPLADLLGRMRERVPAYWSAGFTSYTLDELRREFSERRRHGFSRFKLKVGREPDRDPDRVAAAREAIGEDAELYVDANGAYTVSQALEMAEAFQGCGVTWFEEPVRSEDYDGLARVRTGLPAGMEVVTGEYGWDVPYFVRVLSSGAADVLQADATRCGGVTGFLGAAAVSSAWRTPLSTHTAPSLHTHLASAAPEPFRNLEYFKDHVRLEEMLFEGSPTARESSVAPNGSRPGLGLELKEREASRYEVAG